MMKDGLAIKFKSKTLSNINLLNPLRNFLTWLLFKFQPHKMVKHTQTVRRKFADELFEYVLPICGVGA